MTCDVSAMCERPICLADRPHVTLASPHVRTGHARARARSVNDRSPDHAGMNPAVVGEGALSNVNANRPPGATVPESHAVSFDVDVCGIESVLVHVTVVATTSAISGLKGYRRG